MTITDYCSEYVRDAYELCGAFEGNYHGSYLFSVDDEKVCDPILKIIEKLKHGVTKLDFDGGFVFNYKHKEKDGYVVVQSLYNSKLECDLPNTLENVAEYLRKIPSVGGIKAIIVDNYDEGADSGYHSFDIAFILPKNVVFNDNK